MEKNPSSRVVKSTATISRAIINARSITIFFLIIFAAVAAVTNRSSAQNAEPAVVGPSPDGMTALQQMHPTTFRAAGEARPSIFNRAVSAVRGILITPAANILYVDPAGTCGGNSPCFTTIQAAINAASPGDTINVFAGTYAEQIDVNKALTLLGPNANIDPNTGARVAEATIIPTASDPLNPGFGGPIVVTFSANGVTFKGFTVDGDNPSLTSGVVFNGADVDAEFGIYGTETANPDAVISNNIVKNIGEIAVWINSNGQGGAKNANSRITNNKVDNDLGAFGQGIRISDDAWLDVTNNVVTRVRVGITIENYSGNTTTHPASVIADNNVTA
ncbi:MAG TPA: hypothetical protein VK619_01405, partial [Pyrinomonadaceae bacterium]|nr:hypothetical protein [Pyrinomonadaceae bacterium]